MPPSGRPLPPEAIEEITHRYGLIGQSPLTHLTMVQAQLLQQHLGLSPLAAGLVFLPSAFFAIAGNLLSGRVTNRYGARLPVVAGLSSMVVGLVALLFRAVMAAVTAVGFAL